MGRLRINYWVLWCAFSVLWTAMPGCSFYQPYQSRPLTPAGVQQTLDAHVQGLERIEPRPIQAHMVPQPAGVRFADGISPDEAAYVAVMTNPGLRTIRDQRGLAVAQVIQAGILPNPQMAFNLDSPSFGTTAGTVNADTVSLSWDVSKLNPRGAKILSAIAAADAVDLEVAWQEWLVAQAARQAVFDLLAVRLEIAKLEEAERALQANLKLVEKAVKEGNLTLIDLTAAASASATLRTTVLGAVQSERQQRLLLNRTMGLPPDAPIKLRNNVSLPISGTPPQESGLYPLLEDRLDLISMRRAYESQEQAFRAAVAAQIPTTSFSVTRARDTGNVGTLGAGIAIDLPLFNRNQGAVALQRATRDKLYDYYIQSVFGGRSDIAMAVARLRVIEERIDATQKAVASLEKLVTTYDKEVKRGAGNVLVYYQAFNNLAQSRVQLIQLQREFMDAWILMENTVGVRIPIARLGPAELLPPSLKEK